MTRNTACKEPYGLTQPSHVQGMVAGTRLCGGGPRVVHRCAITHASSIQHTLTSWRDGSRNGSAKTVANTVAVHAKPIIDNPLKCRIDGIHSSGSIAAMHSTMAVFLEDNPKKPACVMSAGCISSIVMAIRLFVSYHHMAERAQPVALG